MHSPIPSIRNAYIKGRFLLNQKSLRKNGVILLTEYHANFIRYASLEVNRISRIENRKERA